MSRLDGVNISDIRSMASQDDNSHYSIASSVARASLSSTRSKFTQDKSNDIDIDRMLDIDRALDDRSQYGKVAAAQDHSFSSSNVISNGYGEVYE